jgi:hypothetical protein
MTEVANIASAVVPNTMAPARRRGSPAATHASHGIAMAQPMRPKAAVRVCASSSAREYGAVSMDTRPELSS